MAGKGDSVPDVFSELTRKEEALSRDLAGRALVDLYGVVDVNGVYGVSEGGTQWTMKFSLAAWRYDGSPVQTRELLVRKNMSESELDSLRETICGHDLIHVRARVAEENILGKPQALLVELVGKIGSDPDLTLALERLREPVTFEDARFGVFTLDRRLDWFAAKTNWGTTAVNLALDVDDISAPEPALVHVRALWGAQAKWNSRIVGYAVGTLLGLKNESWLYDDEKPVSAGEFKRRMTLESITVRPDGSFDFWFDDGDLFLGHSILVRGNMTEGPTGSDIPG
jgi:hypothetical protein